MGRLVLVKCNCGYEDDMFRYGKTFGYPEVKQRQTALARIGKYGKYWQQLLGSDKELKVNAEYKLYQCPRCYKIKSDYCMDLYKSSKPDSGYYTPKLDEVVYQYKHICTECKKRMEEIPLSNESDESLAACPKCGDIAIVSFCGFID